MDGWLDVGNYIQIYSSDGKVFVGEGLFSDGDINYSGTEYDADGTAKPFNKK